MASSVATQTTRAAVLVDVGHIEVRDIPLEPAGPHEVTIRVQAVGLCGTDLHIVAGHANYVRDDRGRSIPLREHPQVLGHEIAGIVEDVGSRVFDVAVSDRVVVDQGRTCVSDHNVQVCEYCESGDSHQCERYREHGITGLPGGFAELLTVPARNCVKSESDLAPELAAMAEPLGCILHSTAQLRRAASRYAVKGTDAEHRVRTILVCGAGPAGLLFVQYLRRVVGFEGALLVSEPNPAKRALASRFGAEALDPDAADLVEQVQERTKGHRVELLIESSGAGAVFRQMPGVLRKQGTVLLYGHGHTGVDLGVLNAVQFLEPTLVAPAGASGGHDVNGRPTTYVRALRHLERGEIEVAPLITHRYHSLDAVPGAFAGDHLRDDYVKGMVLP